MLTKIPTFIISLIAAAAVSATALPAVASAVAPVKKLGSVTQTVRVKSVVAAKKMEAGSAGVPGYSDATCQSLLNDYNTAVTSSEQALLAGASSNSGEVANRIYGQLTDNCLVVD
jgi:hypothetical protein